MSSLTAPLAADRRAPIEARAAAAGIGLAFVAGAAVAASAGSGGAAVNAPSFSSLARAALVVGWACAGFYTWRRRPDSRLGLLIAGGDAQAQQRHAGRPSDRRPEEHEVAADDEYPAGGRERVGEGRRQAARDVARRRMRPRARST